MQQHYEYRFIRLGEGWLRARRKAHKGYRDIVREHAAEGRRLVQIFASGIGADGAAKYFEALFEREAGA